MSLDSSLFDRVSTKVGHDSGVVGNRDEVAERLCSNKLDHCHFPRPRFIFVCLMLLHAVYRHMSGVRPHEL